jgi:hypothetical protein
MRQSAWQHSPRHGDCRGSERWILEAALNVDDQERTLFDHAGDLILLLS